MATHPPIIAEVEAVISNHLIVPFIGEDWTHGYPLINENLHLLPPESAKDVKAIENVNGIHQNKKNLKYFFVKKKLDNLNI